MKKLLWGMIIGAIAAAAGTYIYFVKYGGNETPAAVATSESSLSAAAGRASNDGGAALRTVAMSGDVHVVNNGESIQAAVVKAKPGDSIQVMPGLYKETVFIDKDNIAIVGVIKDGEWPVMDGERKLNDAILYSGNGIRIENMKIVHFKGNAIMGQSGNNFVIRHNWIVDTGVYGIFPEFAQNGLIEYNVVSGIEDAAIYVGMSDNIQVSHNEVFASVAGIEIENSRHAIVENNMVYDNAGGILTFITPGLPIKTTFDVIIRDNFNAGIIIADHKSFANITIDPGSDPSPDRISIYKNLFANNGYAPIADVKALMALNLTSKGPDVLAIGDGKGSCITDRAGVKELNMGSWSDCKKTTSMATVSYLLAKPVPPRVNGSNETAEVGKRLYSAVCAGCHAYNVRMIGPPTQIIQAMYADDAKGIAEYIANPVKKREDFPAMPPQSHLSAEHRLAVANYMLSVKN